MRIKGERRSPPGPVRPEMSCIPSCCFSRCGGIFVRVILSGFRAHRAESMVCTNQAQTRINSAGLFSARPPRALSAELSSAPGALARPAHLRCGTGPPPPPPPGAVRPAGRCAPPPPRPCPARPCAPTPAVQAIVPQFLYVYFKSELVYLYNIF